MLMGLFVYFNQALATEPSPSGQPDLEIVSIHDANKLGSDTTLTSPVYATTQIGLQVYVKNNGTAASVPTDIDIYRDNNKFGASAALPAVAPGETKPTAILSFAPGYGISQYRFVVDPTNSNIETNENNNEFTMSLTAGAFADLVLGNLRDRANGANKVIGLSITAGVEVNLSAEIKVPNGGGIGNPPPPIYVDIYIDSQNKGRFLAASTGSSYQTTDTINWTPTIGEHHVRVVIDPEHKVSEPNTSNNDVTLTINAGSVLPDLQVDRLATITSSSFPAIPSTWPEKSDLPIYFFVKNAGIIKSAPTTLDLLINSEQVKRFSVPEIPAQATVMLSSYYSMAVGSGEYKIEAVVDKDNSIAEMNENNNSIDTRLTTTVPVTLSDIQAVNIGETSATINWKVNPIYPSSLFYRTFGSGSYIKAPYDGSKDSHSIVLVNLTSGQKYEFYVDAQYEIAGRGLAGYLKSEVHTFTTKGGVNIEPVIPQPQPTDIPHADDTPPVSFPPTATSTPKSTEGKRPLPKQPVAPTSEEQALRERIKRLELRISELESKLIEREKNLAQPTDKKLTDRVKGDLLLQVEGNGEVWYVDPITGKKYYFKDGDSAYKAMQAFGLGISSQDLAKIPVGTDSKTIDQDTDADGVADSTESAIGTDPKNPDSDADGFTDGQELANSYSPTGQSKMPVDSSLQQRLKGRIVIDVNNKGGAWYINPKDGKRYFLGNGAQAYKIMKYLSVGATNNDLRKIDVGELQTDATQ